jgi:DNA-binding response OmpR family regulator
MHHSKCGLLKANNLFTARASLLQRHDISVVVCEQNLMPGSWTDVLKHTQSMEHPPSLIVTSRLADDHLWSEVLNLGGWDVLAKPFDAREVLHSVKLAWDHWERQVRVPAFDLTVIKEAS